MSSQPQSLLLDVLKGASTVYRDIESINTAAVEGRQDVALYLLSWLADFTREALPVLNGVIAYELQAAEHFDATQRMLAEIRPAQEHLDAPDPERALLLDEFVEVITGATAAIEHPGRYRIARVGHAVVFEPLAAANDREAV